MVKKIINRKFNILHIILILVILSLLIAYPLVKYTLNWSMDTSNYLYGQFTRAVHIHSPNITYIDNNGVPVEDYGYLGGEYIGRQRNPLTIATQAVSYYTAFSKNGNANDKKYFLNCITWLDENQIDKGNYALWAYKFPNPSYNVSPPWYSAMAQARIMVAYEYAFELTQNEHYRQMAEDAMQALEVPIQQGGVLYINPVDEGKWYAEVAGGGRSSPPLVLNGFIFSLLDLHDFYMRTGLPEAKSLFEDGIAELKLHLSDYDTGRWTYYDHVGNLAYDYQYVHVDQMQQLYDITHDSIFKTYHDKWAAYFPIDPLWARRRLAAYLLDFAIVFIALTAGFLILRFYKRQVTRKKLPKENISHENMLRRGWR